MGIRKERKKWMQMLFWFILRVIGKTEPQLRRCPY